MQRIAAIALALGALAPKLAAPDEPATPPTFVETTEVRLVTIQVRASGASGQVVADLTAGDFQLFEDGKQVAIAHFESFADGTGRAPVTAVPPTVPESTPSPRRDDASLHLAVFLDNAHISPASRGRVMADLRRFLADQVPAGALLSLVSVDPGLHVRVPFGPTPNVRRVLDALDSLQLSSAIGMTATMDRESTLTNIREHQRNTIERPNPGDPPCCTHLADFARSYASGEFERAQGALGALGAYVQSLAALPGRKAMLHVSDGLPLVAGQAAYTLINRLCDGSGAMQGMQWAIDIGFGEPTGETYDPRAGAMEMLQLNSRALLDAVTAAAGTHGVTLYTLQAASMARSAFGSATTDGRGTDALGVFSESANLQDVLFNLAEETGGKALLDRSDLDVALADVAADVDRYYVLGFYPERTGDDRRHRLEVRTRRPDVRLRHTRSYRDTAPDTKAAEAVLGALLHGQRRTDFPLAIESRTGADHKTVLRIRIPLERLTLMQPPTQQNGARHGSFTVFVSVLRTDGTVHQVRQRTMPVVLPSAAPASYLYEVRLDLPPGTHVAAVAIRDDLGGALAVERTEVTIQRR